VRFVDLPAQFTALEPEITAAVMGVLARATAHAIQALQAD